MASPGMAFGELGLTFLSTIARGAKQVFDGRSVRPRGHSNCAVPNSDALKGSLCDTIEVHLETQCDQERSQFGKDAGPIDPKQCSRHRA
jgi:hypothetical protein